MNDLMIEAMSREIVLKKLNLVTHLNNKVSDIGNLAKQIITLIDKNTKGMKNLDYFCLFHLLARQMFRAELQNEEFKKIVNLLLMMVAKESEANLKEMLSEHDIAQKWNKAMCGIDEDKKEVVVQVDEEALDKIPCPICNKPLKECDCDDQEEV